MADTLHPLGWLIPGINGCKLCLDTPENSIQNRKSSGTQTLLARPGPAWPGLAGEFGSVRFSGVSCVVRLLLFFTAVVENFSH